MTIPLAHGSEAGGRFGVLRVAEMPAGGGTGEEGGERRSDGRTEGERIWKNLDFGGNNWIVWRIIYKCDKSLLTTNERLWFFGKLGVDQGRNGRRYGYKRFDNDKSQPASLVHLSRMPRAPERWQCKALPGFELARVAGPQIA